MLPTQFVVLFSTNKKISVLDQVDITMILMAHYSLFLAFNYGDRIFFFFFLAFCTGGSRYSVHRNPSPSIGTNLSIFGWAGSMVRSRFPTKMNLS